MKRYYLSDYGYKNRDDFDQSSLNDLRTIAEYRLESKKGRGQKPSPVFGLIDFREQDGSKIIEINSDKVRSFGYIGFIGCNDTSLSIHSRFAPDEKSGDYLLFYLLERVCGVRFNRWQHKTNDEYDLFDLLQYLFAAYLKRAVVQGIVKQYKWRQYNDSSVRGSVQLAKHLKDNIPFMGRIAYKAKEHSMDNDMTQLIRHTIEYLQSSDKGRYFNHDSESLICANQIRQATPSYSRQRRMEVINRNLRPFNPELSLGIAFLMAVIRNYLIQITQ